MYSSIGQATKEGRIYTNNVPCGVFRWQDVWRWVSKAAAAEKSTTQLERNSVLVVEEKRLDTVDEPAI